MADPTPIQDSPDFVDENAPETIATPEGDNEQPPDQPLQRDEPEITRPRGDEPHSVEPLRNARGRETASLWGLRSHGIPLIPFGRR